jgi:hypothetical protein
MRIVAAIAATRSTTGEQCVDGIGAAAALIDTATAAAKHRGHRKHSGDEGVFRKHGLPFPSTGTTLL